jgi:hypothetical protein
MVMRMFEWYPDHTLHGSEHVMGTILRRIAHGTETAMRGRVD